ncbi:AraC family transcriptional regulator [Fulvivirgaceae bacterium BMA12]|uniref:AraC family transcriptional regulator n=1 Tax=Agaribacillus aureus TaxID=3051825 RepID=A0ABT8LBU9_9BACT|nr:AraC family transcriptional regulator [Fulvivirgaceae bacterium BMA12]
MKIVKFKIPRETDAICLVQEDKQAYFYDTVHQHPELQITSIINGTGQLLVGDYIGGFKPGDVFIIGENQPHVFKSGPSYLDKGSKLISHSISIFFDQGAFREMLSRFSELEIFRVFINKAKKGVRVGDKTRKLVLPKMKQMVHARGLDKFMKFLSIIELLTKCTEGRKLSSDMVNYKVDEIEGKRLNDIIDFTLAEYHRPISLEEVADIAAMAPSSFCRFFKKRTRKTYIQFLTELRIQKSRELLRNKELSILEISFQCGFNTISSFNRKFKAITHCTPSEYHKLLDNY